jgi:Right handed beta helix region
MFEENVVEATVGRQVAPGAISDGIVGQVRCHALQAGRLCVSLVCAVAVVLAFAQCAAPEASSQEFALASASPSRGCLDPVEFGAMADDATDDRAAFQLALDTAAAELDGGTVCIGRGRWTLSRAPLGSYNRFAAISTHASNISIVGAGPESVLEVVGDQGGGGLTVISIDPGARGIVIRDLTIDTSAASQTDEQTHAIASSATCSASRGTCKPISDLEISRVRFVHPKRAGERKGDCIRLLGGTPDTRVERVRISDTTFTDCARSGIAIQRNVHGVVISGNTFSLSGDQDIDSEPTGGAGDSNSTIVISGNIFADRPSAQGDYAITLGGIGGPMTSVAVTGNSFLGRGIALYRSASTTIVGNTFVAAMKGVGGVIDASNVCAGLTIVGNVVSRSGSAGPLVRLTPHSGANCGDVMLSSNTLTQRTAGHGIFMEAASNVIVANNALRWETAAEGFAAIYARATTTLVDGVAISGNRIRGPVGYGLLLSASPYAFGSDIKITGNSASGVTTGMMCTGGAGFAPIASYGNTLGPLSCAGVSFILGE